MQKKHIAMKSKIPKIICGIVAIISFILSAFAFLPSFWFWVSFEVLAALLVAFGCAGEWWLHHHPAGRKKKEKDEHHALESKFIGLVVIGVTMELFCLGHSINEGVKLENSVSQANKQVEDTKSNLLVLSKATLELAHRYDLSTNALAEANARLASIRPIKQRLIALLERISPLIVPSLHKNGITQFHGYVSEYDIAELRSINNEPDGAKYIKSISIDAGINVNMGGIAGESQYVICELQPELAK